MTNPPSFVGYVVMVKPKGGDKFNPWWTCGDAYLYSSKRAAADELKNAKLMFGKQNAYLQQYGPYS